MSWHSSGWDSAWSGWDWSSQSCRDRSVAAPSGGGGTAPGGGVPEPPSSSSGSSGLPPGWEQVTDAKSGQPFYWQPSTGQTSWEPPQGSGAPAASSTEPRKGSGYWDFKKGFSKKQKAAENLRKKKGGSSNVREKMTQKFVQKLAAKDVQIGHLQADHAPNPQRIH